MSDHLVLRRCGSNLLNAEASDCASTCGLMRARVASTCSGSTSMTSAATALPLRGRCLSFEGSISLLRSDPRRCHAFCSQLGNTVSRPSYAFSPPVEPVAVQWQTCGMTTLEQRLQERVDTAVQEYLRESRARVAATLERAFGAVTHPCSEQRRRLVLAVPWRLASVERSASSPH